MWKTPVLILTLLTCGIKGRNVHRNEWAHVQQQEVVSQPSYYSQYGPVLHDLASFQQKLHQQGLAPTYGYDLNPPFTLTYEQPLPDNSYQHNYNQGSYGQQQHVPSYYHNQEIPTTTTKPTKKSTELKGKPNCNHIVKTGEGSENNEHAKKPLHEIDIKWPNIKHDNQKEDKKHANRTLVRDVNETLHSIVDQVEVKLSGIRQLWSDIEKKADNVFQQISDRSNLIDRLNERLNSTRQQLETLVQRLRVGNILPRDLADSFDDDLTRTIVDSPQQPNIVHSEVGKKLRKLVLSDFDAVEPRGDLKNWFSEVFIIPQGSFNKLISEKVSNIGGDVSKLTKEWTEYLKTQLPTPKPTPPKVFTTSTFKPTTKTTPKPVMTTTTKTYTTINWKPKATTDYPKETPKYSDKFTTPDYFKYTIPAYNKFKQETYDTLTDINRMDADVETLKVVDDAKKDELAEGDDDAVKLEVPGALDAVETENDETKAIDEPAVEVDTVKSLDEIQLEVLESVKDTLKATEEDDFDLNRLEAAKVPEDNLKSDTVAKVIEAALSEELRNELKEDKLSENDDETSNVDNSRAENSDESAKKPVEIEEEAEMKEDDLEEIDGDSEKLLEIDDTADAYIDGNESQVSDDLEVVTDVGEDSPLTQPNQAESIRFDELEVIQLVPVIIDQLRKGHVTESEQVALEKVFGDLWPLLLAEAERADGEEMNALLKTILQSEEVRLAKRDITKQIGNDIYKNSVRRVYRGDGGKSPYISLDDDRKLLSPSERLLKMVAAIVHKANVKEKSEAKLRQKQKQQRKNMRKRNQKNPLGIVTVEKARRRFIDRILSINRIKRSIVKYTTDLEDMKAYLEQVNQASDFEADESDEIDESHSTELGDDYFDDDYLYEDYESMPSDDSNIFSQLGWSGRNNYYDDYENGSVNEFIQLAKQRDRREKSSTHEKLDDESYEDDGDY